MSAALFSNSWSHTCAWTVLWDREWNDVQRCLSSLGSELLLACSWSFPWYLLSTWKLVFASLWYSRQTPSVRPHQWFVFWSRVVSLCSEGYPWTHLCSPGWLHNSWTLELLAVLLPQPPQMLGFRCALPYPAGFSFYVLPHSWLGVRAYVLCAWYVWS